MSGQSGHPPSGGNRVPLGGNSPNPDRHPNRALETAPQPPEPESSPGCLRAMAQGPNLAENSKPPQMQKGCIIQLGGVDLGHSNFLKVLLKSLLTNLGSFSEPNWLIWHYDATVIQFQYSTHY